MSEENKVEATTTEKKEEVKKEEKEVVKEELNINKALEKVILQARNTTNIIKGIHEVCKAIDHKQAKLVLLAEDCDEPKYKQLVSALCKSNMVPIHMIENKETLAMWLGFCKVDKKGENKKIGKCSCLAFKDFGEVTQYTAYLVEELKLAPKETKAE